MNKNVEKGLATTILGTIIVGAIGIVASAVLDVEKLSAQVAAHEREFTSTTGARQRMIREVGALSKKVDEIHWYLIKRNGVKVDKGEQHVGR